MNFRKITPADIDKIFVVRSSVHENPFSVKELAEIGITPGSVTEALGGSLDGYLCKSSGRIVGFAMVEVKTGELAVIAVLPEFERRGIGRELLRLTEELLWAVGFDSLWLWTGADRTTRAFRLYRSAGWVETEIKGPKLFMNKQWPGAGVSGRAIS